MKLSLQTVGWGAAAAAVVWALLNGESLGRFLGAAVSRTAGGIGSATVGAAVQAGQDLGAAYYRAVIQPRQAETAAEQAAALREATARDFGQPLTVEQLSQLNRHLRGMGPLPGGVTAAQAQAIGTRYGFDKLSSYPY